MRALTNDEVRGRFAVRLAPHADYFETLMRLGQEQGSIRGDVPSRVAARFVETFIIGLTVRLWLDSTPPSPALVKEVFEYFEQVLGSQMPKSASSALSGSPAAKNTGKGTAPRRQARRQKA